jgi:hypothetical protein
VTRLIENGVSANAADYDGRTALASAPLSIISTLCAAHIYVDFQHVSSSEGHKEIVEFLLENKANVEGR